MQEINVKFDNNVNERMYKLGYTTFLSGTPILVASGLGRLYICIFIYFRLKLNNIYICLFRYNKSINTNINDNWRQYCNE